MDFLFSKQENQKKNTQYRYQNKEKTSLKTSQKLHFWTPKKKRVATESLVTF